TWTVLNGEPTITAISNQASPAGLPVSLQVSATDPEGQGLAFGASGLPPGLGINPGTGLIAGIPEGHESPYAATLLGQDPAAYWRLNEVSGNVVHDLTGHILNGQAERNLSVMGVPTYRTASALPDGDAAMSGWSSGTYLTAAPAAWQNSQH